MKKLHFYLIIFCFGLLYLISGCENSPETREKSKSNGFDDVILESSMDSISKPFARYWWFASQISKEDVRYNMNWLKSQGFGGVEIAWVYPLNAMDKSLDSSYTPRQQWLSLQWQKIVEYTIQYADSIGLACDMTMGTLWPFGDSRVSYEEASQQFGKEKRDIITRSWEYPDTGYVVDHINPDHYLNYFRRMLDSFPQPQTRNPQAYFIDSWEVDVEKLWTDGFAEDFQKAYGYDIKPYMETLYEPEYKEQLYDYRKLISEKVIEFYDDFDSVLNVRGLLSRAQCAGAPADIISAYARVDIPESEAMLYQPEYSRIPASAALLSKKKIISAETFTCLYGWPGYYMRDEQAADLKLVADALFANGVNHIIWHGKPHNPAGEDTVNFYATVHVGPEGNLSKEIKPLNQYMEKVSALMKKGHAYSDVAVYLPTEDAWIKGEMPKKKQFLWAWGWYEMRYIYPAKKLNGYHPMWVNYEFLEKAEVKDGKLIVGDAQFQSLYVDAKYLDYDVLKRLVELGQKGLSITVKKIPREAGYQKHETWNRLVKNLLNLPAVNRHFKNAKPLVESERKLNYFARETEHSLFVFFAHPNSWRLKFPLNYGQSLTKDTLEIPVVLNYREQSHKLILEFKPYQSLLYELKDGKLIKHNIRYLPPEPEVKQRPEDFNPPWDVE